MKKHVPGREIPAGNALQHGGERRIADLTARLTQRRQRDRQELREVGIVDPDQADVVRHLAAEPEQRAHDPGRGAIVRADDPLGMVCGDQRVDGGGVLRIDALHQGRVDRGTRRIEGLAIPRGARVHRRRGIGRGDECQPPCAALQQVLGDHVAGAAIVDADQIVMPPLRIGLHGAIEQDDGDARGVERRRDLLVHAVFRGGHLERREEHA